MCHIWVQCHDIWVICESYKSVSHFIHGTHMPYMIHLRIDYIIYQSYMGANTPYMRHIYGIWGMHLANTHHIWKDHIIYVPYMDAHTSYMSHIESYMSHKRESATSYIIHIWWQIRPIWDIYVSYMWYASVIYDSYMEDHIMYVSCMVASISHHVCVMYGCIDLIYASYMIYLGI